MGDLFISILIVLIALWYTTPLRYRCILVVTNLMYKIKGQKMQSQGGKGFEELLDVKTAHTNIVGATGDGKTVLARAIMAYRAKQDNVVFCIVDPHAAYGVWGDMQVHGKGRNYAQIEDVLNQVLSEMNRRYFVYANEPDVQFSELNVFVDEVPAIATHCKKVWTEFVSQISSEGRKVNIRLTTMAQSNLVELFGIKGRSDLLRNFTEYSLGEYVPKALRGSNIKVPSKWEYPIVVTKNGVSKLYNGYGLHTLAMPELKAWQSEAQCGTAPPVITEKHSKNEFDVRTVVYGLYLLSKNPNITARAMAKAQGWGNGAGTHNQKAQRLIAALKDAKKSCK